MNFEEAVSSYLDDEGYDILSKELFEGLNIRPDLVVEKDKKRFIIEIKQKVIDFYRTLKQIRSYIEMYKGIDIDGYILVIPEVNVPRRVENLYKKLGIGILKIKDDYKPKFLAEPKDKGIKNVEKDEYESFIEKSEKYNERAKFKDEIILNVIFASIFTSSLWLLIESLCGINILSVTQFGAIILICISSLLGMLYYIKRIIKKGMPSIAVS